MCNSKALFATSAVLSLFAAVLFLIGAAGHGDDQSTVESIPWGTGKFDGVVQGNAFLGLQGFLLTYDIDDDYIDLDDEYESYGDCNADFCDTCEDVGATVVALCVISLILAVVTIACGAMGAMSDDSMIAKIGCTLSAVVAAVLSIVAFIVFRPCFADFVDDAAEFFGGSSSATYGIAAWLTLIGFIIMCLVTLLSAITFCVGGGGRSNDNATTGVGM